MCTTKLIILKRIGECDKFQLTIKSGEIDKDCKLTRLLEFGRKISRLFTFDKAIIRLTAELKSFSELQLYGKEDIEQFLSHMSEHVLSHMSELQLYGKGDIEHVLSHIEELVPGTS